MAVTKKPLTRYKILDSCFRNAFKKYTKESLLEKVNDALFEITDDYSQCIKLRQLQDDIAFMKSEEGWSIELEESFEGRKRIYRYSDVNFSINNSPLNEVEMDEIKSAIQILSQFEGMHQFEGIQEIIAKLNYGLKDRTSTTPLIGFDSNQDLKGIENFSFLYNAVQKCLPLEITYKDFRAEESSTYILHPYYLKQYNNRWFLFGLHQANEKADWNVAIDRIVSVKLSNDKFIENKNLNWQDYFSDFIGVTKTADAELENVVLHFSELTGKYMENKSIHETQKHKWIDENTFEVKIKVIINYELERLILSYCDSVKVIQPQHLQEKIKMRLSKARNSYQ